jgi:hypothetical protein
MYSELSLKKQFQSPIGSGKSLTIFLSILSARYVRGAFTSRKSSCDRIKVTKKLLLITSNMILRCVSISVIPRSRPESEIRSMSANRDNNAHRTIGMCEEMSTSTNVVERFAGLRTILTMAINSISSLFELKRVLFSYSELHLYGFRQTQLLTSIREEL